MAVVQEVPGRSEDTAIRTMIADLEQEGRLTHDQTVFLRDRWLGQLLWFEKKAAHHQGRMNRYRIVLLAGGVLLPVVVNLAATRSEDWIQLIAVLLSLVVGFVAGLEAFQRPGERWLRYRQTAERLRAEWWLFVNLAGDEYGQFPSVADAYPSFVVRVQSVIEEDVTGFVAILTPSARPGASPTSPSPGARSRP